LYAQYAIVNYQAIAKENMKNNFYFDIIRFHDDLMDDNYLESKILNVTKNNDTVTTTVSYKINSPTCAIIGDGWGHEIIISPNDTVNVFCEKYLPGQRFLRDSLLSPWNFKMAYKGKSQANLGLFDSLAYLHGALHHDNLFFKAGNNKIKIFFQDATNQYIGRRNYIIRYNADNPLSPIALKYAIAENKYSYLSKLISPFLIPGFKIDLNDLPKEYIDSLYQFEKNNYDLFKNTAFYSAYLQTFTDIFKANFNKDSIYTDGQNLHLLNAYSLIKDNNIKDYFSTKLLKTQLRLHKTISSKTLKKYRSICTNKKYVFLIDSLIKSQPKAASISFTEALESKIISSKDTTYLDKLIDKIPIVIDCWASWCKPCIAQMKYSKELEEKYKNKIDFIYLSFDKNVEDWKNKSKELNIETNNFLILQNFKSGFANYFNLFSIPRYIIIGKGKTVIDANAPMPSKTESFTKILDKLIK